MALGKLTRIRPLDYALLMVLFLIVGCGSPEPSPEFPTPVEESSYDEPVLWDSLLTRELYYDKVLGMLVGSAIGDAMGAPTEMWDRTEIKIQKGYVSTLDPVIREGSPEGPWNVNLPGGGTTDDTRWKYLFAGYLDQYQQVPSSLNARDFADYITDLYLAEKQDVGTDESFEPDQLETEMRHMTWLQEWALVAKPYVEDDLDGYSYALNKFYGGEMACAGMLYAPMVGLYYPADPVKAYTESYRLGIFDLGYARDITGLTAAYLSKAMQPGIAVGDLGKVTELTDPNGYFKSRLVGRIAHRIYQDARRIAFTARKTASETTGLPDPPADYPYDAHYLEAVEVAYNMLDTKLQDIPFHAGEIHLINLTAIEFGGGDFSKTLEFVVNYGRDNDTVAAVTGAILGAYLGFDAIPAELKEQALKTNRDALNIDLQELAQRIVDKGYQGP